jgi:drug/metabolite transporter (DMT)-like permease
MNPALLFIILAIVSRAVVPGLMGMMTNKNKLLIISLASFVGLVISLLVNWYYKISILDEFKSISGKDRLLIIALGAIGVYGVIYFVIGALAESKKPVITYAIINALTPVVSFMIAYFFFKEEMSIKKWIALGLMTLAIYLLQS